MNLSLWEFACAVYAKPGIESACLELQDHHHVNLPLLLFCCWSGRYYGTLPECRLQQAQDFCHHYSNITTFPLRTLRRQMKSSYSEQWPISASEWHALREQVKTVELDSERLVLTGLARLLQDDVPKQGEREDCMVNIQYCFGDLDTSVQPLQRILSHI